MQASYRPLSPRRPKKSKTKKLSRIKKTRENKRLRRRSLAMALESKPSSMIPVRQSRSPIFSYRCLQSWPLSIRTSLAPRRSPLPPLLNLNRAGPFGEAIASRHCLRLRKRTMMPPLLGAIWAHEGQAAPRQAEATRPRRLRIGQLRTSPVVAP